MAGAQLRVTSGPMEGKSIPLGSTLTFGRAEPDPGTLGGEPQLSREHARLSQADGGYRIEDLGLTITK